ncbi:MAG: transporter [Bacillota bacterium]
MRRTCLGLVGCALLAGRAEAARPLITDDAEPVAYKHFQIQAGVDYRSGNEVQDFTTPVIFSYGVVPRLEIGVGSGAIWEHRDEELDVAEDVGGALDTVLAAKWKVLDQEKFLADQTLELSIKLPTASESNGLGTGQTDEDVTWVVTRKIASNLQMDVNVGYTFRGSPDDENLRDLWHYGIAVEYLLTKHLQPVAEVFGETPVGDSGETVFMVNAGIRWLVAEGLVLDGAVGTGIRGEAPDVFATVGLTWVF